MKYKIYSKSNQNEIWYDLSFKIKKLFEKKLSCCVIMLHKLKIKNLKFFINSD